MTEFITENWGELLIGILAFAKVIVNITPTENDNEVFAKLDKLINFFIEDKIKNE